MRILLKSLNLFCGLAVISQLACSPEVGSEVSSIVEKPETDFVNYSASVSCSDVKILQVDRVEEIQQAIKMAKDESRSIKVSSTPVPHSYNDSICPQENGIILDLSAFKSIDVNADERSVTVGAAVKLNVLQETLDSFGLTFPVGPDFDDMTIAGMTGTGAHHSSLKYPSSVSDWVEEITLVDADGKIQVITGENLDVARVHLGLLGAIYSLKLKVIPQRFLKFEARSYQNVSSSDLVNYVKNEIPNLSYGRVRWFPSQDRFIVDAFTETEESGQAFDNAWQTIPPLPEAAQNVLEPIIQSSAGQAALSIPARLLNLNPKIACLAENVRTRTFSGTISKDGDKAIGKSHDMIASSCRGGGCPWELGINSRTLEVGFPVSKFAAWTQMIDELTEKRGLCIPANGLYLRFSKASKGALAQAYGEDAVLVEIHIATAKNPQIEPFSDAYQEIMRTTVLEFGGRLHWGKNSTPYYKEQPTSNFPKWDEFIRLKSQLDPDGVFESKLWKAMEAGSEIKSDNCGVDRSCFCEIGELVNSCGRQATCVPGSINSSIGVCKRNRWF